MCHRFYTFFPNFKQKNPLKKGRSCRHMGRPKERSQRRRSAAQRDHLSRIKRADKENIPVEAQEVQNRSNITVQQSSEQAILAISKKLANSQRQNRRLKAKNKDLQTSESSLNNISIDMQIQFIMGPKLAQFDVKYKIKLVEGGRT